MQKNNQTQTPGTVLKALLEKHSLNCNRLAKAINMSNAMVRLLVFDKSPVSIAAAFRLAKFFKNKPEYWLTLQMKYDLEKAADDKALAKEVAAIEDADSYTFVRKPHEPRSDKKAGKGKAAEKSIRKTSVKKAAQ